MIELANLTAEVFKYCLPESFYSESDGNKGPGGEFQTYYSKQREKEIAINRLNPQRNKRKSIDKGETYIKYTMNKIDTNTMKLIL